MAPSLLLNGTLMWINATSGVFFVAPMLSGTELYFPDAGLSIKNSKQNKGEVILQILSSICPTSQ
jgi:hypothetical protein